MNISSTKFSVKINEEEDYRIHCWKGRNSAENNTQGKDTEERKLLGKGLSLCSETQQGLAEGF